MELLGDEWCGEECDGEHLAVAVEQPAAKGGGDVSDAVTKCRGVGGGRAFVGRGCTFGDPAESADSEE